MNTGEKRLNRERGKAWKVDLVKTEQLTRGISPLKMIYVEVKRSNQSDLTKSTNLFLSIIPEHKSRKITVL